MSEKLPLSCKTSAELGSNSSALVKSSIAWYPGQKWQEMAIVNELTFLQENHITIRSYEKFPYTQKEFQSSQISNFLYNGTYDLLGHS